MSLVRVMRARKVYDATSYDLNSFKARGGEDLDVVWSGGRRHHDDFLHRLLRGGNEADGGREKTENFFMLFLIPGVHHCFGGPRLSDCGPDVRLRSPGVDWQHLADGTAR